MCFGACFSLLRCALSALSVMSACFALDVWFDDEHTIRNPRYHHPLLLSFDAPGLNVSHVQCTMRQEEKERKRGLFRGVKIDIKEGNETKE